MATSDEASNICQALGVGSQQHLSTTEIPAEHLQIMGYDGPPLVMSNLRYTSELKHINDAQHKTHGDLVANVGESLAFVRLGESTGRPRIVYTALQDIEAGEELLMDWGRTSWIALCENLLNVQAITSHWYNRWQRTLQHRLQLEGIPIPQFTPGCPLFDDQMLRKTVFIDTDTVGASGVPDYIEEGAMRDPPRHLVGRCRLTASKPVLKAPTVSALEAII